MFECLLLVVRLLQSAEQCMTCSIWQFQVSGACESGTNVRNGDPQQCLARSHHRTAVQNEHAARQPMKQTYNPK